MKSHLSRQSSSGIVSNPLGDTQGMALVAALVLMAILSVMGATVLTATSTEVAISGNYRRGVEAFYLAEAGNAEGRARLRGDAINNPQLIADPSDVYDPRWTAYILTSPDWKTSDDKTYNKKQTNYFPLRGDLTNSRIIPNSLQKTLPYWVKIKHKTEYDAEREGHRPDTPHYLDSDGSIRKHTRANPGNVIFYGYPSADFRRTVEFTSDTVAKEYFPVERITASADMVGGSVTIEVEAIRPPIPRALGALYVKNDVSLTGPFNSVSGIDQCGKNTSLPPIYTGKPSSITGPASFSGVPPSPQHGPLEVPLVQTVDLLRRGALQVNTHHYGVQWGTDSSPMTVYVDAINTTGSLVVSGMTGYGTLLVHGDMTLEGPVNWKGLIIGSGKVIMNGTTGSINISGGVLTNEFVDVAGSLTILYDSCAIRTAILSKPLVITKWKQIL